MIMTKNIDIFNILSGGERVTLECKKATKGVPVSLWDTYSAFANTYGGIILLIFLVQTTPFGLSILITICQEALLSVTMKVTTIVLSKN